MNARWLMCAGLTLGLQGCGGKKDKSASTSALDDVGEVVDATPKAFFGDCQERAEMKAGNHFKVFDCGQLRASYYDSPGKMTYEEVIAPISSEGRSLGYHIYPSEGTMTIRGNALPIRRLDHKTPPALGGELKFSTVVVLQPLEGDRTRIHECKMPGGTAEQSAEWLTWCNGAFDEMFSYEKSAEDALNEMKGLATERPEEEPEAPKTVVLPAK